MLSTLGLLLSTTETSTLKTQVLSLPLTPWCWTGEICFPGWPFAWNVPIPLFYSLMIFQDFFKAHRKCYLLGDASPHPPHAPHAPQETGGFFVLHHHWASTSTMTSVLVSSTGKQKSMAAMSRGYARIEACNLFPPVVCWQTLDMFSLLSLSIPVWKASINILLSL